MILRENQNPGKSDKEKLGCIISQALKDEDLSAYNLEGRESSDESSGSAVKREPVSPKRHRREIIKRISIVAVFILMCIGVVTAAMAFIAPADASKDREKTVEKGGGITIVKDKDGNLIDENDVGVESFVETDWGKVKNYKNEIPQLIIPHWIPNKYKFNCVEINLYNRENYVVKYIFSAESEENLLIYQLTMPQESGTLLGMKENGEEIIKIKGHNIYIEKANNQYHGVINYSNYYIEIYEKNKSELIKVIKNLK